MTLTGKLMIGASDVPGTEGTMKALNPASNQLIEPAFALGGVADVDKAATLADEAFDEYSHTSLTRRAAFLDSIADNLDSVRKTLAARAALETGLPEAQLEGEAIKAATQFRQFAEVVRRGASCNWPSTRRSLIASHARAWTIDCRRSPSVRWRFSARAIFRSRTRSPGATPLRHWRLARRSS